MFTRQWEYDGQYLVQFPKLAHGTIANYFCYAVRDGFTGVGGVLSNVEFQARRRIGRVEGCAVNDEVLETLIASLGSEDAEDFALFILWREQLPPDERTRLKEVSGTTYRNGYMAQQPATEKQIKYLRALGCQAVPQSKLEASQLIEQHKR